MKQSANALTFTGLVGAVAVAGASQAYGTIINVAPPTNLTGNNTATFGREYWNALTGTTSTARPATFSLQFGYENKRTAASYFPVNTIGSLGFQFQGTDGALHDGWIELDNVTYTSAANPGGLIFLAAAYNSVADNAGGTIAAGLRGTNAVPEPGTLAALAAGAAALTGVGLKLRKAARAAKQA